MCAIVRMHRGYRQFLLQRHCPVPELRLCWIASSAWARAADACHVVFTLLSEPAARMANRDKLDLLFARLPRRFRARTRPEINGAQLGITSAPYVDP